MDYRLIERRSSPQTIAWFVDLFHGKQLDLDPEYQRRSVWNEDFRRYFIDTVLKNYPSPAVFLDVEITPKRTVYHVVDGKQRLSSILDFLKDKFKTTARYSGPELGNRYYSELPESAQTAFLKYIIPVEFLDDAKSEYLIEAFDRLNRNVARLNSQELRHARFSGAFISLMEALADDPLWKSVGISTTTRIRRMTDVEFVSEIFVLTMFGVEQEYDLDEVYAKYDYEIPEADVHRNHFEIVKEHVKLLWPHLSHPRFSNLADFYSLWAAVLTVAQQPIDYELSGRNLSGFGAQVRDDTAEPEAQQYLLAATQGSNKASNRKLRAEILARKLALR